MDVKSTLLNRLQEKRHTAPWAYDSFIGHLTAPTQVDRSFDALVILSYEERDAVGNYLGMKYENAERVRAASGHWNSLGGSAHAPRVIDEEADPREKLVIVSSSEAVLEMYHMARQMEVPSESILVVAKLPLRECNSGQQMRDLAAFAVERGWQKILILSSFYHMLRCECTANVWFKEAASIIERQYAYIWWPALMGLADPQSMDKLLIMIDQEIQKVIKYCPPEGVS